MYYGFVLGLLALRVSTGWANTNYKALETVNYIFSVPKVFGELYGVWGNPRGCPKA